MSHTNISELSSITLIETLDELDRRLDPTSESNYCLTCDIPEIRPDQEFKQRLGKAKDALKQGNYLQALAEGQGAIDQVKKLIAEASELNQEDLDDRKVIDFLSQRLLLPIMFDFLRKQYQESRLGSSKFWAGFWRFLYFGLITLVIADQRAQEWMTQDLSVHRIGALAASAWKAWIQSIKENENDEDNPNGDNPENEEDLSDRWPYFVVDILGFSLPFTGVLDDKPNVNFWYTHGWDAGDVVDFPDAEELAEHTLSLWWERPAALKAVEANYKLKPANHDPLVDRIGITLIPLLKKHGGPFLVPLLHAAVGSKKKLSSDWELEIKSGTDASIFAGDVEVHLRRTGEDNWFSFGNAADPQDGASLAVKAVEVLGTAHYDFGNSDKNDLGAIARIKKAKFSLGTFGNSELLKRALPKGLSGTFDVGFGISKSTGGFYWEGGLGLDIYAPIDITTPPIAGISIDLPYLQLTFGTEQADAGTKVTLDASLAVGLFLGPLKLSTTGLGAQLLLAHSPDATGTMGPLDFQWNVSEPTSLGIALFTRVVSGGGFIARDLETDRWTGAMSLKFSKFSLDGIVMTEGNSVLGIVWMRSIRIPLFGGAIEGFGILVGCDRRSDREAFAVGLKNDILNAVLFPDDPVGKAPLLLNTLGQLFPRADNRTVLGIMAQWVFGGPARLVVIELGILLDFEGDRLRQIAVLGQGGIRLRKVPERIFSINVELFGAWDFENDERFLKLALRNSRVAGSELAGEGILYKGIHGFIFSVGGFNPRFPVPPSALFNLTRVTAIFFNRKNFKLTFQGYFAWTSCSLQVGFRLNLWGALAGFNLEGVLGLDVLSYFDGRFTLDAAFELALRRGSKVIASIGFSGTVTGSSTWRLDGKARFKFLFLEYSWDVNYGSEETEQAPLEPVDALAALQEALETPESWIINQKETSIVLRDSNRHGIWMDASNTIRVSQTAVPLRQTITRIGPSPLLQPQLFEIQIFKLGGETKSWRSVEEQFAPGLYQDIDLDESIRAPMFEPMQSGLETENELKCGTAVGSGTRYDESIIDDLAAEEPVRLLRTAAPAVAIAETIQIPESDFYIVPNQPITVSAPRYLVTDDNLQINPIFDEPARKIGITYARARQLSKTMTRQKRLNIVHRHEVAGR
jgi:hypothetical protein